MRKHTKIYLDGMGFCETEFIQCEVCGKEAVDIHHIFGRGIGGTKKEDTVESLIALCRACHIEYGDKKQHMEMLISIHKKNMNL